MLYWAASKVGRNLNMGWDGAGDFHDRANRMARSKSTSGGGQFTGGVKGMEGAGSEARNPGKGEFMLAAATPAEDEGGKSGLISGAGQHGGCRQSGEGGSRSSMPGFVVSNSSLGGSVKCIMFNVPRRLEAAADASLLVGLLVGLGPGA